MSDKVSLLSVPQNDSDKHKRAFDFYNMNGEYIDSISLLEGVSRGYIGDDKIVTTNDSTVVCWKYEI